MRMSTHSTDHQLIYSRRARGCLEVAVESEGTLRPGALLAPLLGLDTNAAAALSVRKLHTVFQRDRPTVDAALP